jgi:hypothetical protein
MTDAERYANITSLLNTAGRMATQLAEPNPEVVEKIGDAAVIAFGALRTAAANEGRDIVAA